MYVLRTLYYIIDNSDLMKTIFDLLVHIVQIFHGSLQASLYVFCLINFPESQ